MSRKTRRGIMPRPDDPQTDFRARQRAFAAHVRNPELHPPPGDVDPRRMQVYRGLVFDNLASLLGGVFPVARRVVASERWRGLVREFLHRHASRSPYFLDVSQEFLTFLAEASPRDVPPFLLELCHYEWVELSLSAAAEELPTEDVEAHGDLLAGSPVVSPLLWRLAYAYPVHLIGPEFQPSEPGAEPTRLLVWRRRDDSVGFMVVNVLTVGLLDELEAAESGDAALRRLAARLPRLSSEMVYEKGLATLERLRKAEVLLGTRLESK